MHETNPYSPTVPEATIHYFQCPACRYDIGVTELECCPECGCVPSEVMAERKARYQRRRMRWTILGLLAVMVGLASLLLLPIMP